MQQPSSSKPALTEAPSPSPLPLAGGSMKPPSPPVRVALAAAGGELPDPRSEGAQTNRIPVPYPVRLAPALHTTHAVRNAPASEVDTALAAPPPALSTGDVALRLTAIGAVYMGAASFFHAMQAPAAAHVLEGAGILTVALMGWHWRGAPVAA